MYRSILVPLDGSPAAEHALPWALSLARLAKAALQIAAVHVPAAPLFSGSDLLGNLQLDSSIREKERSYLDGVVRRLVHATRAPVTSVLLEGPIADALSEQAKTVQADLIVMTTHGRGPLSRFWLGSVADKLVRQASVPVLVVRPQEGPPELIEAPPCRHILIPLDGTEEAEQILEPAVQLGSLMQADYELLLVIVPLVSPDPATVYEPAFIQAVQTDGREYLEEVAERLRARSLRVHTRVIFSRPAAMAILEEAGTEPATLIALETHGRGGVARLLLGSVADKVLRGASVPVLVHRPPG
jgi:nucleotide-binding universal stress UspA family protein